MRAVQTTARPSRDTPRPPPPLDTPLSHARRPPRTTLDTRAFALSDTLRRASRAPSLTAAAARATCTELLAAHSPTRLVAALAHIGDACAPQRDLVLSELVRAARKPVPAVYAAALRAAPIHQLPRTRRAVHQQLCHALAEAPPQGAWRALLHAHASVRDWARLDEALRMSARLCATTPLDVYRYTLVRLQHDMPTTNVRAAINAVLAHMRADGARLDDALLARLVYALAVPVRRASAAHAATEELDAAAAPVQQMLHVFFVWLCRGSVPLTSYRTSLVAMLELELYLVAAQHYAQITAARMARRPYVPRPPREATERVRAKLAVAASALRGTDGLYERVLVQLDALAGDVRSAMARLETWMAEGKAAAAPAQRHALVALFSHVCRGARAQRMRPMLHLLAMASRASLWRDEITASSAAAVRTATLVRLWTRFLGAWTHAVGVRHSRSARTLAASAPHGWALASAALSELSSAAQRMPTAAWARVVDHPERCRTLAWVAVCAPGDRAAHVAELCRCLEAVHAPPRAWRWSRAATHEASAFSPVAAPSPDTLAAMFPI